MGWLFQAGALFVNEDTECLRLYTADITAAYLSTFEFPGNLQKGEQPQPAQSLEPASLTVHFRKIPLKPYSTLRERLIQVITPLAPASPPETLLNEEERKWRNESSKLIAELF